MFQVTPLDLSRRDVTVTLQEEMAGQHNAGNHSYFGCSL
jgi:hypothetical protein